MDQDSRKIAFLRRGFSASGGAEAYLQRLAAGVCAAGHETHLITTEDWPPNEWSFGPMTRVLAHSPTQFADGVEELRPRLGAEITLSLERVWRCDFFRAGDGVHRAWLERRALFDSTLRKIGTAFNRKHQAILRLESSLLGDQNAGRVIANSQMVKCEIVDHYGYPAERIEVIYNGLPLEEFRVTPEVRAQSRVSLGVQPEEVAVLFVGSGWERKGLRFAIEAITAVYDPRLQLLVAGRGNETKFRAAGVRFLGVVQNQPALYAAADIFILPTIYDPFSNASLEALAAGIPVITTRANGFAEVIEHEVHGSIVDDPADVGALRSALGFWSDAERRANARIEINRRAERFALHAHVTRTLDLLLGHERGGNVGENLENLVEPRDFENRPDTLL